MKDEMPKSNPKERDKKPKKPCHWLELGIFLLAFLVILFSVNSPAFSGPSLDAQNASHFGDFIGGFLGTVLLVISGCLVVAGYNQQKFTENVRSFEAHFFEMLKYHRDNMTEIEVDGICGRRAFVSFIREWRLALKVVREAESASQHPLAVESRARLAYLAFFHGSGPNARKGLRKAATFDQYPKKLVNRVICEMSKVWRSYGRPSRLLEVSQSKMNLIPSSAREKPLAYIPFEGHHSRLAHYYRHLFQLVDYVHRRAPEGTESNLVKLIRAQLSTHEQALLALHVYSIKDQWSDCEIKYIPEYDLIGDLPEEFLDPQKEFPTRNIYHDVKFWAASQTDSYR